MVIANDKLRMEKFDRLYAKRVAVYEATRSLLAKAYGIVTEADIRAYGLIALDAQFLFDEEMFQYLRQVRHHVECIKVAEAEIANLPQERHEQYIKIRNEHLDWIREQGDGPSDFSRRFRPFLVHEFPKRHWWLRWPE